MLTDNIKAAALTVAMVALATFNATSSSGHEALVSSAAPPQTLAVIDIPAPKEGRLLHLRGMVGKGRIFLRMPETQAGFARCAEMRLRFVAGDFSGREHLPPVRRIQMEVRSADVLGRLVDGAEIISDEIHVSTDSRDSHADVILRQGLLADTGFVLNPGDGIWAEVFGPKLRPVPCRVLTSLTGGAAKL